MYDIILYGASGFTGGLVADYLHTTYGTSQSLKWAIAGRTEEKLQKVCSDLNAPELPVVLADADKPDTLRRMCEKSKVVISTVGPYQKHGEPLIQACTAVGTDYVDLCGEVAWMAEMIHKYQSAAQDSGARMVFSCGYDSLPFDMGVYKLQQLSMDRFGKPAIRVRARIRRTKGGLSGGTLASGIATAERAASDSDVKRLLADHFALTPGFTGPPQPTGPHAYFDNIINSWTAPFIMADINTRNIHRSNYLLGHRYGKEFLYDERQMTGDGADGKKRAFSLARKIKWMERALKFSIARYLIGKLVLQPGKGPSKEKREAGYYDILFVGLTDQGEETTLSVQGNKDPGYGATAGFLAESAMCLAHDMDKDALPGGFWTCASAMGDKLYHRLVQHAEISFETDVV
jgi:short subunit dehydrogenase-like uncharacterized protein